MKLTKTQRAYLKSAAINPTGKTFIAGGTDTAGTLLDAGYIEESYFCWNITPAGRAALSQGGGK